MARPRNVTEIFNNEIKEQFHFNFELKDEQVRVVDSIPQHNHTVGVFPTGFGKSICYLLPPLIFDRLDNKVQHTCIVVSPLKSLMLDQCKHNASHGISAAVIQAKDEMSSKVVEGIKKGTFSVLYMSPETLLDIDSWKDMLLGSKIYKESVCLIAIDEEHIMESW
ncbi:probable ATP-dependent DNA helicase RecQ [Saccostrea cucullata]|uniref:probable ATP-dependent DNA helicase RecQ n=1 Tax=Saccostrea cuccullata TaxID=36930 RepID=UPI002ED65C20